ncbi:universal stress protein [Streptosporangium sp. NPDC001681]|uniref:universal stress protein n=1 Tax=Streptosporangium sp. NPDC001681 TaxID=3154395 RepID=UPI00332F7523
MTAHVVVGTDGSAPAEGVVAWAADDAVRRRCALRIGYVCEPWTYDIPLQTPPGFRDSVTEYCQGALGSAVAVMRGRAPHLEVEVALREGRVTEILQREAEGAEQIVVGGRGLGGFTGLLLGSVSLALAGRVAAPIVIVALSTGRRS